MSKLQPKTARQFFRIGDRVISRTKTGIIVGFIRGKRFHVKVMVDGDSKRTIWKASYWTKRVIEPMPAETSYSSITVDPDRTTYEIAPVYKKELMPSYELTAELESEPWENEDSYSDFGDMQSTKHAIAPRLTAWQRFKNAFIDWVYLPL